VPPLSVHPGNAARPYRVRSVRWLLAVALLGLGWLLAWAPAAVGQAPTVLVTEPPVKMGWSLIMGMVLPGRSDPEPP
jgi:hypothetical protein